MSEQQVRHEIRELESRITSTREDMEQTKSAGDGRYEYAVGAYDAYRSIKARLTIYLRDGAQAFQ